MITDYETILKEFLSSHRNFPVTLLTLSLMYYTQRSDTKYLQGCAYISSNLLQILFSKSELKMWKTERLDFGSLLPPTLAVVEEDLISNEIPWGFVNSKPFPYGRRQTIFQDGQIS